MSQNIPPNQPGQEGYNPYEQAAPQQQQAGASPYAYQQTSGPDLDANAPTLKSHELQKINRKGMFFLAGIIALLLLTAFWLLSRATSGGDEEVEKPREEAVVIPELPDAPPVEDPIPLAQEEQPTVVMPPQLPPPLEEAPADVPLSAVDQGPSLVERRMGGGSMSGEEGGGGATGDPALQALLAASAAAAGGGAKPAEPKVAKPTSALFINNPDSLMVRGTYIRCILETRIITDVPGFTSCIVTEPVYSINGRRLLLPKGSKVYGSYASEDPKIDRVAVVWDRITTPSGLDINMESPGVDNLGSSGHKGQYNSHWGSKITSALLISLVSDAFKIAGEKEGPTTTEVTSGGLVTSRPYQSTTAKTIERMAEQVLDRNLSRPATVTINQGTLVNVYVAQDVSFAGVVGR